ncbi:hypothetical protein J6590_037391 [Homalodisca vitripennis]|nr:hypothetical protein J6590_037391 [Homalodisca vitripennis]
MTAHRKYGTFMGNTIRGDEDLLWCNAKSFKPIHDVEKRFDARFLQSCGIRKQYSPPSRAPTVNCAVSYPILPLHHSSNIGFPPVLVRG